MSSYNNSINSIRFKWKIQDFHRVASINKCGVLISEEFNYNRFKNLSFHLEFCPINLDSRTHSSLYIRSKNVTKDIRQQLNCNFWVENSNGDWLAPCEDLYWLLNQKRLVTGHENFIPHSTLYKSENQFILSDDILVICCEIEFVNSPGSGNATESISQQTYEGCVVRAGDAKFYFKKDLLCKNEIFERMLTSPNFSGVIELSDMRPEVARTLLNFIFYNDKYIPPKDLEGLFVASKKFLVDDLKQSCISIIRTKLGTHNFFGFLVLAFRYNDEDLKKTCLNFASKYMTRKYFEDLIKKPHWSDYFYYDEAELEESVRGSMFKILPE